MNYNKIKELNIHTLFYYSISSILLQFVTLICEFLILKMIPPTLIGIWQFVLLIQGYAVLSRLGIINAFNREYPYYLNNDKVKAESINSTTFTFSFFNSLLLLSFFSILSLVFIGKGLNWFYAFLTMAGVISIESLLTYYLGYLRSINKFNIVSIFQILNLPVLILSLFLPYKYGFKGLCARILLIQLSRFILVLSLSPIKIKFHFDKAAFNSLFSIGWKFYLWGYLKNFSKSIYRLVIVTFGGTQLLGLFAPVNWMTIAFTSLSGSISEYMYPNLSNEFSKRKNGINQKSLKVSIITLLIFLPISIVGFFLLPSLINYFLPEYVKSITAMKIALIASLFDILPLSLIALAVKLQFGKMYTYIIVSIIVRFLFSSIFYLLFNDKMLGISIAILCSSIVLAICAIFFLRNDNAIVYEENKVA